MNIISRNAANAITCLNLISGCAAIIFAFSSSDRIGALTGLQWAWIAIGVAAVADFLDGFTARLTHTYSMLGKELDSLCDLVSFGVAPAMLVYNMAHDAVGAPEWLAPVSIVIAVCGALRLARFNIDTRQTSSFIGMPIPANAIFWTGYTSLYASGVTELASVWWLLPVILIESWLMVSNLHMFSLKFKNYGLRGNLHRYFLIAAAIVMIFCLGVSALLYIILLYILISLFVKK